MSPRIPVFIFGGISLLAYALPLRAGALKLDGSGDYVTFPGAGIPIGNSPFTIESWINPTSIPTGGGNGGQITFWGTEGPTNNANGLRLRGATGTRHYFWGNDHDEDFGIDILPDTTGDGGWHHLAVSYDGNQTRWYWNGAPLGSPRTAGAVSVANANFRIGSRINAEYFDGLIDEIRIWETARSAAEIAGDYDEPLSGGETDLIAYFDFEGDYGDRAGGDNSGTPVGNATIDAGANAPVGTAGGALIESFTATPALRYEGESSTLAWDVDETSVSGSLVIEILSPGGEVVHGSSTASGDVAVVIGDTGGVAQTLTYTLRARESGGAMISREATADIAADPGIPTSDDQSLVTVATAPLAVTLGGSDPNNGPDALSFTITGEPGGGSLSGTPPQLTYTANGGFIGGDSFTFITNDGKYDSAPATVSIDVVPAPAAPTDIALSTTSIGEAVTNGGLIATLSSSDANPGDTHTYSLVAGAGDSDNGLFAIAGNQLRAATEFAGLVGNSYSIRLRTLDSGGLGHEASFVLTVVEASEAVVINEIHYNPPENPVRQEYIELYNPATSAADLDGWRLSGAVDFVFPNGTSIPPNGYLVIAEEPATLLATLSADALGPYAGRLDSEGETIRLRDANDRLIDEVDYKVGFPWPVASNGGGASIELINPSLDNSLGSSWRASVPQLLLGAATLLPFGHTGWSWRPGDTEASAPIDAWRESEFSEDASWTPGVRFPIGYGAVNGVPLNTQIEGMRNAYNCVFLRSSFTIAPGEIPSQLELNYTADDGCVIWINGAEVERFRIDEADAPTIGDLANGSGGEGDVDTISIANPGAFLVEGSNTVAVQLFNMTQGSSDLGFDLEIDRPAQEPGEPIPTPGGTNTAFASNAAPNIRKVDHSPAQPTAVDPVLVTAKITDPDGVASVTLEYQVVDPGAYVPARLPININAYNNNPSLARAANAAYESGWAGLTMLDDGSGGDVLASDDIFSVTLPTQAHRTLVRYRITVEDELARSARVPYPDDASLNFAYFVYDGVPSYEGHSAAVLGSVPVYHIITRGTDYAECLAYSANQIQQGTPGRFLYNWNATIVYDGKVYDNIRYRLRGANGRYYNTGKRSMRFRLNDGDYFQARDQQGKNYPKKWRTLTTGKGFDNKRTLTYGLNEAVNMHLFNKVGVPAIDSHWVHWRVIDGAAEAPDKWRGDFHGLNLILETYDVRFMEAHDLEKGNLYKLINQTNNWRQQQRYQAASAPADGSDHNTIENQLDGGDSADYIRAHVSVDKWNRWHSMVEAIRHYDYWPSANKNMVYYFEPDYLPANNNKGRLWILPWDTDASWGPNWNSGHDVVYNALFSAGGGGSDGNSTPELWPEYFNAMREIRDLLWQPDQINPVIDEFASFIQPLEAADASRWKGAPADAGNYNGLGGAGASSIDNLVQDMKNFAFSGWSGGSGPTVGAGGRAAFLDSLQASNGEGGRIPITPNITYTGSAGFPTNGLSFQSSSFSDPQGNGSFGAMQWRIAQITDPSAPAHDPAQRFKLEIEADWESGELMPFSSIIDIPTVAVRSGLTYRARVRHQDNTGRWSHWSAPVEFTTTLPDISDYLDGLVITEIMYHPADPSGSEIAAGFDDDDFFEYIELKNVGDTTLDLTDVRFTKGVDFDFLGAAITSLAPGEIVLVVKHMAAFTTRYGAGLPVAGAWQDTDRLDNGGERVKLSFGAGDTLREFIYDDFSPWPTAPDGSGVSLTLDDPASVPDHALAISWRGSFTSMGTPGLDEAGLGYDSWRDGIFGEGSPAGSGPLDDPDRDGVPNLAEYALGGDPLNSASTPSSEPQVVQVAGEEYLALTYVRRVDRPDITYRVEVSANLEIWESGPGVTSIVGAPVDHGDGTESVTEGSLTTIAAEPRQYLRVLVEFGG